MRPSVRGCRYVRRTLALSAAVAAALGNGVFTPPARAVNTEDDVTATAANSPLDSAGSYASNPVLPGTTSDVTFTAGTAYAGSFTLNTAGISIGTLNDLNATPLAVTGTQTLTLNGGSNSVAPAAADLLYVATGGSLAVNAPVSLLAAGNFDTVGAASVGAVISGSSGLTKTGAGTLTLTGANTFTGAVGISAGTLSTNSVVVAAGASGLGAAATPVTLGDATNKGTLSYTGGAATFTRGFTINAGGGEVDSTTATLTITAPQITLNGPLTFGGASNVSIADGATVPFTGTGALNKTGAGTLTITTTGTTAVTASATPINVNQGTLSLVTANTTTANVLGTGLITIAPGATLTIGQAGSNTNTYGNAIAVGDATGTATLTSTSGAVPITGAVTFPSGANAPTLQIKNTNGTAGLMTFSGGFTGTGNIQFNGTSGGSTITLSGATVNNTGTISNVGASTAAATISAPVGSNVGNITEGGANPLTITGAITLGGSRAYTNSSSGAFSLAAVTGSAATGTQTITFSATGAGAINETGVIANGAAGGNVAVVVNNTGTGLYVPSGASTYSGGTTIQAGATVPQSNTVTSGSAITSGPYGTGPLTFTVAGGGIRATTGAAITLANPTSFNADTTFPTGGAGLDQNLTFTGPITLSGTRTFTVNTSPVAGATGVFFSGAVAGTSSTDGLTKAGTGTLVLQGANTYTGATTVNAGVLEFYNTQSQPASSAVTVASGATLALGVGGTGQFTSFNVANATFASGSFLGLDTTAAAGPTTISSNLALGTGVNLNKIGTGTLALTGANTYSGTTLVASGVLNAADGAGLPSTSNLTLNSAAVSTGNAATFAPTVAAFERPLGTAAGQMQIPGGTSGFTSLLPSTTVDFGTGGTPAALTWGGATFNPAALALNDTGAAGALTFTNAINLGTAARTVTVNSTTAGTAATLSGQLTGGTGGALTKAGAGQLNVTNATNSYTGTTTISAGTLSFNGGGATAGSTPLPSTGAVQINAGTFQVLNDSAGTLAYGNTVNLGGTQTISVGNNGGATTGSTVAFGALNAPATAANTATTTTFTGGNGYGVSFTGLNLPGGTGQTTTLVANTNVTIAGNVSDRESGFGSTNFDTLVLDGTATGNLITGVIADATGGSIAAGGTTRITKQGTGTWTLTGSSTYVGLTTVSAGTLALGSGGNLNGTTAVTVNGGTFAARPGVAGATNTLAGTLTLNSGANFSMADGVASTFNVTSATTSTLAPATGTAPVLTFDLNGAGNAADLLALTTAPTVGAAGAKIAINPVGATGPTGTSFTVITAPSGLGTAAFSLSSTRLTYPGGAYNLSLSSSTATAEVVTLTSTGVYYTGNAGNTALNATSGSTTNFSTDPAGTTDVGAPLGTTSDVFFTATSVTTQQVIASLGQNYTFNTLNYTPAARAITINNSPAFTLTVNAGVTVAAGSAAQTLNVPVVLGGSQTWTNNGTNLLTFGGTVNTNGNTLTIAGAGPTTLGGALTSTTGITKTGAGTLTLTGTSTYTGATTVAGGVLQVGTGSASSGSISTGTSNTIVASTAGNAVLNIPTGGSVTTNMLQVGSAAGSSGAVNLTGGSLTMTQAETTPDATESFGAANGAYGALSMTGGTFTPVRFMFGGTSGSNGIGVGQISNGTVNTTGYVILARSGASTGVVTISGGTINHSAATQDFFLGLQGNGRAELNADGGTINNSGRNLSFSGGGFSWTGTGVLNFNAGTVQTNAVAYGSGTAYVNFNGGTLKSNVASTTFLPNTFTRVVVNGPFGSFNGGAVFDTPAAVTVGASLLAPTGNGVSALAVGNGGSGYIGAPYVSVAGTGTGATAVANMVPDGTGNGTLQVGSITVTNPGVGYTGTPTFTFVSGGAATAATPGSVTTAPDTSGGLTKLNTATLTLSGANTYTGPTTVSGGVLKAGAASVANVSGAFGNNSAVTLANAAGVALDITGFDTQIGSLTGGGAAGGNVTLGAATLTVGGDNSSPAPYAGAISGTGNVTKVGAGTTTLTSAGNAWTGTTAVNAGALFINGTHGAGATLAGSYSIASGATLGGTGTINLANNAGVTVAPGGTLAPGSGAGTALTVNTAGGSTTATALTLADGSNFKLLLTHSATPNVLDGLNVPAGVVNLGTSTGPNLVLTQDGSLQSGDTFTIIDPTTINGTFAGGLTGTSNGIPYTLAYNTASSPETVTLTVGAVPEPAAAGLLAAGALGLLARRRRRATW